jgi:hypothetical protein
LRQGDLDAPIRRAGISPGEVSGASAGLPARWPWAVRLDYWQCLLDGSSQDPPRRPQAAPAGARSMPMATLQPCGNRASLLDTGDRGTGWTVSSSDVMTAPTIWYLIKFFTEEKYANQFMAGELYLNTLSYFKKAEKECTDDGRLDSTEAVAMWLQPDDIFMKLTVPGIGKTEITGKDLAAPISSSFDYHNHVNILCLYAVKTAGFLFIEGKIRLSETEARDLQRQWKIDERCFKFGQFAVIMQAVPFIKKLREALTSQGRKFKYKLVDYYDEAVFHGTIPTKEVPFRKQKRFSYQQEFRLCVYPTVIHHSPITIEIGNISDICRKAASSQLNNLLELKTEPATGP